MITWMQTHRKYLVPTIWISTISFVGMGFVGWDPSSLSQAPSTAVAKVGEKEITVNELQDTYSNLFSYYNQIFGGKLTQEKAQELKLEEIALQKLTNEALLLNYASELGIKALDEEVLKEYTSIKAFQENGVFNEEQYEKVLRGQGLNPKVFEQGLQKSIILKKMRTALNLPTTALEKEANMAANTISDHLVIKKITQALESINLNEEEIHKAWEDSKQQYMSPISYLLETIKVPSQNITVTKEELQNFYDEKKYMFKDPEGKILAFDKTQDALNKAVQLKKAKTAILKKYLAFKKGEVTAEKEITVDATNKEFPIESLKEAKEGDFIKTIALADGYLTAKVKAIHKPEPLSYEKAKNSVEAKLRQEKAASLLEAKAKEESSSFSDGKDIGFVTQNDVTAFSDMIPPVASGLLRHIFSTPEKTGYYINGNTATLYQIKEQKLLNTDINQTGQDISTLKDDVLERGLIKELKKRYTIENYIKKEG